MDTNDTSTATAGTTNDNNNGGEPVGDVREGHPDAHADENDMVFVNGDGRPEGGRPAGGDHELPAGRGSCARAPGGPDDEPGDDNSNKKHDHDHDHDEDDHEHKDDEQNAPRPPEKAALCPLSQAPLRASAGSGRGSLAVLAPDGHAYAADAWKTWVRCELEAHGRATVRSPMNLEEELECPPPRAARKGVDAAAADEPARAGLVYGAVPATEDDLKRQVHTAPSTVASVQRLQEVLDGLEAARRLLPREQQAWHPPMRLVAVGREDTGKSRTLCRLVNLCPFATSDDVESGGAAGAGEPDAQPFSRTCTRCPVKLELRHSHHEYGVPRCQLIRRCGPEDGDGVVVHEELAPCEGLHRHIHRLGLEAVRRANEVEHEVGTEPGARARVTRRYFVRVQLRSKLVPDVDLVDTPGLVSNDNPGEGGLAVQTRDLVRAELTESAANTFVLAVIEPWVDPKDESVLHLVREAGLAERTIRVVTKMDTDDVHVPPFYKRQLKAAGENVKGVPAARLVLRMHAREAGLGVFGVANMETDDVTREGDWHTDTAARRSLGEQATARALGLDGAGAPFGVAAVMAAVQGLYLGHALSTQLQGLRAQVLAKLGSDLEALAALGVPEPLLPNERPPADHPLLQPMSTDKAYREAVLRVLRLSGACQEAAQAAAKAAVQGPVRAALNEALAAAAQAATRESARRQSDPTEASLAIAEARASLANAFARATDNLASRAGEAAEEAARGAVAASQNALVPSRLARLVEAVAAACGGAVRGAVAGVGAAEALREAALSAAWVIEPATAAGADACADADADVAGNEAWALATSPDDFCVVVRQDAAAVRRAVGRAGSRLVEAVGAALGGGGEAAFSAVEALSAAAMREESAAVREGRLALWGQVRDCQRAVATLDRVELLAARGGDGGHAAARLDEEAWRAARERLPLPAEVPWFFGRPAPARAPDDRPLRVVVFGAGPAGLSFAISLVEYLGADGVRVALLDSRVGPAYRGPRRKQVVTLRDDALRSLSARTRRCLLGEDAAEVVWSAATRNVPISAAEDRLRALLAEDGELAEAVEIVPLATPLREPGDAESRPEVRSRLHAADVVVAADGARSFCCEHVLRPGQGHVAREDDGETPRVDRALGVEFEVPAGESPSGLPREQAANVVLTLAQRRFLLNASATRRRGYLNVQLSHEEYEHVRTAGGDPCTARRPGLVRPADGEPLPGGAADGDEFWPARSDAPPEARRVYEAVLAGLTLFGLEPRHVKGIVGVELRVRSRARYTVQQDAPRPRLGLVVGDAAMQTHFWPGRGMNTGLKSAVAAALCVASMAHGGARDNMARPCREVHHFEGFMAALANRELDGRSNMFLCGTRMSGVLDTAAASLADGVPGGRQALLNRWAEAVWRQHRRVTRGAVAAVWPHAGGAGKAAVKSMARKAAECIPSAELAAMLSSGPWPRVPAAGEVLPAAFVRVVNEMHQRAPVAAASGGEAAERLHRFGLALAGGGGGDGAADEARAAKAAAAWGLAAERGHDAARLRLAACHETGRGVPARNEARAADMYRDLADRAGSVDAKARLAACLWSGRGDVQRNEVEAVRLFQEAARDGHPHALFHLGQCEWAGLGGLAKDEGAAIEKYEAAAALDHAGAKMRLRVVRLQRGGGDGDGGDEAKRTEHKEDGDEKEPVAADSDDEPIRTFAGDFAGVGAGRGEAKVTAQGATPLWFRCAQAHIGEGARPLRRVWRWEWTPYGPDVPPEEREWLPCPRLEVQTGQWRGQEPVPANCALIRWLGDACPPPSAP